LPPRFFGSLLKARSGAEDGRSVASAVTGIADHSVDYQLSFTSKTNPHSSLTFSLHWDLL
jgi:hypothetical protein